MKRFLDALQSLADSGTPAAVATVVRSSGSVPRRAGAKMIVTRDGLAWGSIGGGAFESRVVEDALGAIDSGAADLRRYTFSETGEDAVGQVCGGTVEVYIEPVLPAERLLIFGAGHVGRALARHADGLGFEIVVLDDRPEFLVRAEFPASARLVETDETYSLRLPRIDSNSWIAVVTRCHRTDRNALAAALGAGGAEGAGPQARYVGLIGSKRKRIRLFEELLAQGFPRERLDSVHAPIGLAIGAETPSEIAVAIAAELVRERRLGPSRREGDPAVGHSAASGSTTPEPPASSNARRQA